MSVIAKMNVASVREFGAARLIVLGCVYEGDGLNSEAWEDRRFTKATPWGEAHLTLPAPRDFEPPHSFYLVFSPADGSEPVYRPRGGHSLSLFVRAQRVETWPGTVMLELVLDRKRGGECHPGTAINIRHAIDNPAASDQFEEGKTFLLTFYRADRFTLADAAAGAER